MSFNRGFRRDDRSSYRSNMGHNSGQRQINVSPWECGVVPNAGMSRNAIPIQSLLPTPQTQTHPNILSQQQHALVMASNLLSNLGLLQQQPQHHQELPSLINMSNLNNMGNAGSFRLQSQNYGQASHRYGGNNLNAMRRKPQDNHRVEPYKNRPRPNQSQQLNQQQGRRPVANKSAQDRKSGPGFRVAGDKISPVKVLSDLRQKLQKPAKTSDKSDAESKELEVIKSGLIEMNPAEESHVKDSLIDEEAKRDDEEDDGKKRDWKDEKKTDLVGVAEDNLLEQSKMDVEKTVAVLQEEDASVDDSSDNKVDEENSLLKQTEMKFSCHVCNKYFSDEQLLNNHIKSKTHKQLMVKLDESYKIQVEALRLNMQDTVRQQELDMERQRGGYGRAVHRTRDFCKMCDLNFFGSIANHRKNDMHLKLKTFLHPRCVPCGKEFPTRMEWESHKLSAAHQTCKQVKERNEDGGLKNFSLKLDPVLKEAVYDPFVTHGQEYLITGQQCRACDMFFERRADARVHCKTLEHFDNCAKAKANELAAAAAAVVVVKDETVKNLDVTKVKVEEKSAVAEELPVGESELSTRDPELSNVPTIVTTKEGTEDNEGNWKRRRVAETEDDDDDGDVIISLSSPKREPEVFVVTDTPPSTVKSKEPEGNKLYDPLEEEEEMDIGDSLTIPVKEKSLQSKDDCSLEEIDQEIDSILDGIESVPSSDIIDKVLSSDGDIMTDEPVKGANKARRGGRARKKK